MRNVLFTLRATLVILLGAPVVALAQSAAHHDPAAGLRHVMPPAEHEALAFWTVVGDPTLERLIVRRHHHSRNSIRRRRLGRVTGKQYRDCYGPKQRENHAPRDLYARYD